MSVDMPPLWQAQIKQLVREKFKEEYGIEPTQDVINLAYEILWQECQEWILNGRPANKLK